MVFLQWQCRASSSIDYLAASSLFFLQPFVKENKNNQLAAVFDGGRIVFSPGSMRVIMHCCHQVDYIFCFSCSKATDATEKITIKHALSRSCGGWFLHHHVKNNLETINLQHWWWCFCGGNAAPPAALTTLPHPHCFLAACSVGGGISVVANLLLQRH